MIGRSVIERTRGRDRRENGGMSSDKTSEKLVRRKAKGSWIKIIFPGLVGS